MSSTTTARGSRTLNQWVGIVLGAIFLIVGLAGFLVTEGNIVGPEGGLLLGIFMVNVLHNIAHLAIGAALALAGLANHRAAVAVNMTIGVAYLLLGLYGLVFAGEDTAWNFLALNSADNWLHFLSAALLIVVAALGSRRSGRTPVRR